MAYLVERVAKEGPKEPVVCCVYAGSLLVMGDTLVLVEANKSLLFDKL